MGHTDEKPFACSVFEYKCIKESNLKRHMVTNTGLKLLLCTVWERLYSKQAIKKSFENT